MTVFMTLTLRICMSVTKDGRSNRAKTLRTRRFEQFAHDNTCDRLHRNGSVAAAKRVRSHQPVCRNNLWEAQSVIGLPVLSILVLDLLGD